MVKKKKQKPEAKPILLLTTGIILATLAYPAYIVIIGITKANCRYGSCGWNISLGMYYVSLLVSGILAILALVFIVYGIVSLVKYRKNNK